MELNNTYVLQSTSGFARGDLDNVAVADDCVTLERVNGRYVLYGCYTSPQVPMPAFNQVTVSWNADTPAGTVVEAQVRVLQDGSWSAWSGFGKWSPYLRRQGVNKPEGVQADCLTVQGSPATQVQLRVYLYTDDEKLTPAVWLLAASVRPADWKHQEGRPVSRVLYAPAYSQKLRDPAFGSDMDLPVAVAALMNRSGADVLPEVLAHMMFDETLGSCGNRAFAAAAAGCCGFEAYSAFMDVASLRGEIRSGFPVAVHLNSAHTPEEAEQTGLPLLTGSRGTGSRMAVVRGFLMGPAGEDQLLINDPLAPTDAEAECTVPLEELLECWDNQALAIHRKRRDGGTARPMRVMGHLKPLGPVGEYQLEQQGVDCQLPQGSGPCEHRPLCTFGYTVQQETVYATTAHKAFHFLEHDPAAGTLIRLPEEQFQASGRITVYAIDWQGNMMVSDVKR